MKNFKKTSQLSLVSAVLLGFMHFPVQAQTAPNQGASQDATVSGDNNQVTQVINQTIIIRPNRGVLNRLDDDRSRRRDRFDGDFKEQHDNQGKHKGDYQGQHNGDRN